MSDSATPRASLVAQMVKNLPVMQETRVWSLGREDPLEKGMATHSNILAWRIHGRRSLAGYSPWGPKESGTAERLTLSLSSASVISDSAIPWTVTRQDLPSMGFSKQEDWSGLPCTSPGDLPNAGIEPLPLKSLALTGRFFATSATWAVREKPERLGSRKAMKDWRPLQIIGEPAFRSRALGSSLSHLAGWWLLWLMRAGTVTPFRAHPLRPWGQFLASLVLSHQVSLTVLRLLRAEEAPAHCVHRPLNQGLTPRKPNPFSSYRWKIQVQENSGICSR